MNILHIPTNKKRWIHNSCIGRSTGNKYYLHERTNTRRHRPLRNRHEYTQIILTDTGYKILYKNLNQPYRATDPWHSKYVIPATPHPRKH